MDSNMDKHSVRVSFVECIRIVLDIHTLDFRNSTNKQSIRCIQPWDPIMWFQFEDIRSISSEESQIEMNQRSFLFITTFSSIFPASSIPRTQYFHTRFCWLNFPKISRYSGIASMRLWFTSFLFSATISIPAFFDGIATFEHDDLFQCAIHPVHNISCRRHRLCTSPYL